MKVDIGVYVNGNIVDSVFILVFNFCYDFFFEVCKVVINEGFK